MVRLLLYDESVHNCDTLTGRDHQARAQLIRRMKWNALTLCSAAIFAGPTRITIYLDFSSVTSQCDHSSVTHCVELCSRQSRGVLLLVSIATGNGMILLSSKETEFHNLHRSQNTLFALSQLLTVGRA